MRAVLYIIIRWYCLRLPFPHKGLKYFESLLRKFNLQKELFVKKLPNGLLIETSVTDHIEKYLLWYGYYEKKEALTMQTLLRTKSVMIDIGANIGYYSLMAAEKITAGHIYSFEPVTKNLHKLKRNSSLNSFTTIHPLQAAISNVNGDTTVYISEDDNSGMSGLRSAENFSGQSETAKCFTLDNALIEFSIPEIDLVKIDVEGSEVNVLKGMARILAEQQPVILIEISAVTLARYNEKIETIYNILYANRYVAWRVKDINVLEKIINPIEEDLVFFVPEHYRFPPSVKLLQ